MRSMPRANWTHRLPLACLLAACVACTSKEVAPPIGEQVSTEPELLALEAWRGNEQYILKYQRAGDVFYAAGDLRGRVSRTPPDTAETLPPRVNALKPGIDDDWSKLTRSLTPVPILGVQAWGEFRDRIFASFMPTERNTGVALSFERGDYFFFYDRAGRFRARLLSEKPPWYSVSAHVDVEQYFDRWQPVLQQFLREQGVGGEEVLFNTGDLENGAIPFIYIDTQTQLVVLIRYDTIPEDLQAQVPGTHLLRSIWHFVGSQTYAVTMRPFTSAQTLLALVSDTAAESGRSLTASVPGKKHIPPINQDRNMDLEAWERELDRRLGRGSSRGTLDFLVDGDSFFPRFIDTVGSARESVDLRAYIFDNDDVALMIANLLKRRANEGIDVRVLFDGLGTILAGGETSASLPETHRAPKSIKAFLQQDSRAKVRSAKNIWLTSDHAKTMVIDQRLAFLGGMNIGREYRYDWHDLMMEISGPVVDEINREFDLAWRHAGLFGDFAAFLYPGVDPVNQDVEGYPLRLVYTKPGQEEIYALQRKAIQRAQGYIFVENAYFTDDELLHELIFARRRGVDVRVVIPLETDRGMITRNIVLAANTMLEHGIRVFIYPGFTHAKAAVFDGWACVGSANLDRLSLHINREINVATSEPVAVQELLDELFLPDFEKAAELSEPLPEQWNDKLIEMFGDFVF